MCVSTCYDYLLVQATEVWLSLHQSAQSKPWHTPFPIHVCIRAILRVMAWGRGNPLTMAAILTSLFLDMAKVQATSFQLLLQ